MKVEPAPFSLSTRISLHHVDVVFGDRHAQAVAAVSVGRAGVLLGEGFEELRKIFFVYPDTGVFDREAEGGRPFAAAGFPDGQADLSRRRGEFDGIAQDVDQHLLQLHVVAAVIIRDAALDPAFILQAFVRALAAGDDVKEMLI